MFCGLGDDVSWTDIVVGDVDFFDHAGGIVEDRVLERCCCRGGCRGSRSVLSSRNAALLDSWLENTFFSGPSHQCPPAARSDAGSPTCPFFTCAVGPYTYVSPSTSTLTTSTSSSFIPQTTSEVLCFSMKRTMWSRRRASLNVRNTLSCLSQCLLGF